MNYWMKINLVNIPLKNGVEGVSYNLLFGYGTKYSVAKFYFEPTLQALKPNPIVLK